MAKLNQAFNKEIAQYVLAYRDGVLESTSKVLTKHDARQIRRHMNLCGKDATLEQIIKVGKPFRP